MLYDNRTDVSEGIYVSKTRAFKNALFATNGIFLNTRV